MAVLKVRQNGEWVVVGTGEKGEKGDAGNIKDLDTSLSLTSTNAVQNNVITQKFNNLEEKLLVTETISYSNLYSFLTNNFDNVIKIKINTFNTFFSISSTIVTLGTSVSKSTGSIPIVSTDEYLFVPSYKYRYPSFWFIGGNNGYQMRLGVSTGGVTLIANGIYLSSSDINVEYGTADPIPTDSTFDVTYSKA